MALFSKSASSLPSRCSMASVEKKVLILFTFLFFSWRLKLNFTQVLWWHPRLHCGIYRFAPAARKWVWWCFRIKSNKKQRKRERDRVGMRDHFYVLLRHWVFRLPRGANKSWRRSNRKIESIGGQTIRLRIPMFIENLSLVPKLNCL